MASFLSTFSICLFVLFNGFFAIPIVEEYSSPSPFEHSYKNESAFNLRAIPKDKTSPFVDVEHEHMDFNTSNPVYNSTEEQNVQSMRSLLDIFNSSTVAFIQEHLATTDVYDTNESFSSTFEPTTDSHQHEERYQDEQFSSTIEPTTSESTTESLTHVLRSMNMDFDNDTDIEQDKRAMPIEFSTYVPSDETEQLSTSERSTIEVDVDHVPGHQVEVEVAPKHAVKPKRKPEVEPEPKPESEAEHEHEVEPKPEPEPEAEPEHAIKPKPKPKPEGARAVKPKPKSNPGPEAEHEHGHEVEPKPEPETEPEHPVKPKPKPEGARAVKPKPHPHPKPEAEHEHEVEPKPEPEPEPVAEPEHPLKLKPKPAAARAVKPKPKPKPVADSESEQHEDEPHPEPEHAEKKAMESEDEVKPIRRPITPAYDEAQTENSKEGSIPIAFFDQDALKNVSYPLNNVLVLDENNNLNVTDIPRRFSTSTISNSEETKLNQGEEPLHAEEKESNH